MIKAVFIDYMGTVAEEGGKELKEVIARVCRNSSLNDPKAVVALWWKKLNEWEESAYLETYLTGDEIVERILGQLEAEIGLKDNLEELHELMRAFWVHAPLFEDVSAFFEACPAPIYIISNNGVSYLEESMLEKQLSPAGIVCSDMVRAYKPHTEIFEKALELSNCRREEAVHIGDSYSSDVQGALAAGIRPILLQRGKTDNYKDIKTIKTLSELIGEGDF